MSAIVEPFAKRVDAFLSELGSISARYGLCLPGEIRISDARPSSVKIASGTLRSVLRATRNALANTYPTAASEPYLDEIADLLDDVVEEAHELDDHGKANPSNQLTTDSTIASIARISRTTSFRAGVRR